MRPRLMLLLVPLYGACHSGQGPAATPAPQTGAHTVVAPGQPGPARIPCDTPVVIKATSDFAGVEEERAWLKDHYPGHSRYSQGLQTRGNRAYDVLEFTTADGKPVSVCFDITSSFGHY